MDTSFTSDSPLPFRGLLAELASGQQGKPALAPDAFVWEALVYLQTEGRSFLPLRRLPALRPGSPRAAAKRPGPPAGRRADARQQRPGSRPGCGRGRSAVTSGRGRAVPSPTRSGCFQTAPATRPPLGTAVLRPATLHVPLWPGCRFSCHCAPPQPLRRTAPGVALSRPFLPLTQSVPHQL